MAAPDAVLLQWWEQLPTPRPRTLAVAYSTGADSTALLLAAWHLLHHAKQPPERLLALHVHHGLQAAADQFVQAGQALCAQLQSPQHHVAFCVAHAQLQPQKGESVEAVARQARYQLLSRMAIEQGADMVLLAHHAQDQMESVLLALSRGAGVAGLAGMAPQFERYGTQYARPWLALSGKSLRPWLQQQGVGWQEDPTNTDLQFTRNRIRHTVLPALEAALPSFAGALARSAQLAAQTDTLLQDLAQIDLAVVGNPPNIKALQTLSSARQINVLRFWLKNTYGVIGSQAQMQTLHKLIVACTTRGHHIHLRVGAGFVQRNQEVLQWLKQSGTIEN